MLWDFRGPNAQPTAEHHLVHLKEYAAQHDISLELSGCEHIDSFRHTAFVVVEERHMSKMRQDLNPHRGQRFTEK